MKQNLIVIPTFNEKENIARLIEAIENEKVPSDILVVDDNSPDGTGRIVEKIRKNNSAIHVLHRTEKAGLGRAYVAGFKWGMEKGYRKMFSMDADFSHPYTAIRTMLNLSKSDRVVIGSRYIKGGKIVGWNWYRYLNSWGANFVTRMLLGIKAKDATAGFKCYPVEFFKKTNLDTVQAAGYAFQVEMLLRAQDAGFKLVETPITFTDRVAGESKIQGELKKSAKVVFNLAVKKESYRQFVKFAIVGATNTGVDWAAYVLINTIFKQMFGGMNLQLIKQLAKACSFVISAASSYVMNRKWTFRSTNAQIGREAVKFLIVSLGGLAINQTVFYFATGRFHFRDIFGLVLATAAATFWNFFINRSWTFKPDAKKK